jgi:hypothetical protein
MTDDEPDFDSSTGAHFIKDRGPPLSRWQLFLDIAIPAALGLALGGGCKYLADKYDEASWKRNHKEVPVEGRDFWTTTPEAKPCPVETYSSYSEKDLFEMRFNNERERITRLYGSKEEEDKK